MNRDLQDSLDVIGGMGYCIAWARGLDHVGLLVRDHRLLVLDAERETPELADAVGGVLRRLRAKANQ